MNEPRETTRPQDDGKPGSLTSDLAARIARAQNERPVQAAADRMRQREMTGLGRAFRLASEFVAAVIVGAALGWGADMLFGTAPCRLVVAGFLQPFDAANRPGQSQGAMLRLPTQHDGNGGLSDVGLCQNMGVDYTQALSKCTIRVKAALTVCPAAK